MARTLTFKIFRYNPQDPGSEPHMQDYQLEEFHGLNVFLALNKIREEQDPSLQFDFVCRAGICGSCAMVINGRPGLACKQLTVRLPKVITLTPLPVFKLVGDLSVDTGSWFREMAARTGSWVHTAKQFDPDAKEDRMSNDEALEVYELERCIECGCCIAACATANMREDFLGAAGLNRVARFMVDPRDERADSDFFDVIGTDDGAFGCMGLMACDDLCPKHIPLQAQLARVRRAMSRAAFSPKKKRLV
ncbi:MAG: fumarate reductase iron-sulfur subunit [Deltaproteobacteria bacterium]|nr:fumarate reductase iron-sulfur subunit [Deltaproteobacteria bacterium]